jgi:hypothetical protein
MGTVGFLGLAKLVEEVEIPVRFIQRSMFRFPLMFGLIFGEMPLELGDLHLDLGFVELPLQLLHLVALGSDLVMVVIVVIITIIVVIVVIVAIIVIVIFVIVFFENFFLELIGCFIRSGYGCPTEAYRSSFGIDPGSVGLHDDAP